MMPQNSNNPLPSEKDKEDTTQIRWVIEDITVIAERNDKGGWNVYAMEGDIIISNITQNVSNEDLLFVVEEYKNRYYQKGDFVNFAN